MMETIPGYVAPDIPVRFWTESQQLDASNHLAGALKLDLERNLWIIRAQFGRATDQRNDNALMNLQMMENITIAAINKREFGDE